MPRIPNDRIEYDPSGYWAEWGRRARAVLPNGMPAYVSKQTRLPNGRTATEWVPSPWAAYFD